MINGYWLSCYDLVILKLIDHSLVIGTEIGNSNVKSEYLESAQNSSQVSMPFLVDLHEQAIHVHMLPIWDLMQ
jgi:hypothetical protein